MATKLSADVDRWLSRKGSGSLRPVVYDDIEMLRLHRNRTDVRRWLEYDAEITPEEQELWFKCGGADGFRIVTVGGRDVGLARLNLGRTVGCDAFQPGDGSGAVVLELACRELRRRHLDGPLDLWVFVNNHRGLALYERAGFVWDTRTELKWFMRDFGSGTTLQPYGRMILQP